MGAQILGMLEGFSQSFGEALGEENKPKTPANPLIKDKKQYTARTASLGDGVRFVSAEEISGKNGSKGALVRYAFEDIRKVSLSLDDTTSAMDDMQSSFPQPGQAEAKPETAAAKEDPITFDFDPGSVASLTIKLPRPDEKDHAASTGESSKTSPIPQNNPAEMQMAKQMLGDMAFVVVVDGEVVESNATHQEGNATTLFSMSFGKMLENPDSFAKLQALEDENDFDKVKEALKDVDGMKFETNEEVNIKFK